MTGRTAEARAILAELAERSEREFISPYLFAYVDTGLGEHDRALAFLERAVAERTGPPPPQFGSMYRSLQPMP